MAEPPLFFLNRRGLMLTGLCDALWDGSGRSKPTRWCQMVCMNCCHFNESQLHSPPITTEFSKRFSVHFALKRLFMFRVLNYHKCNFSQSNLLHNQFVYSVSILLCIHTHPQRGHNTSHDRRSEQKAAFLSLHGYANDHTVLSDCAVRSQTQHHHFPCVFMCVYVCLLTCSSSSWSPPTSSATATEAKGRLAICCRSLISCYRGRQKKRKDLFYSTCYLEGNISQIGLF